MNTTLTRYIIIAVVTIVVLFIAWYFSDIVAYVLISAVLSIVAKPLIERLNKIHIGKKKIPRGISATIGLIALWLVAILFFYIFIPLITDQMQELSSVNIKELGGYLTQPLGGVEHSVHKYVPNAQDFSFNDIISERIGSFFNAQNVNSMFGSVANMLSSMAIALFAISFITFFFMKEENLFASAVTILFPKKYEENITRALNSINRLLVRYFLGMFLDVLCVMILITLGLTLVAGLPFSNALVIGLVAGVLNVIPYVGPLIGAIFGLVIAAGTHTDLLANGSIGPLLFRIAFVFVVMKVIDDAILQPYIFSNSVKAHPLEIFLVILIAGSLGGILGMLLAIPAYTVLRVFAKEFFNKFRLVQKLTENM